MSGLYLGISQDSRMEFILKPLPYFQLLQQASQFHKCDCDLGISQTVFQIVL